MSVRNISYSQAFVAAAVVYGVVTVSGLLSAGLNPDDWAMTGLVWPRWMHGEGRWGVTLIVRHLLQARFLEPIQMALAFALFWRLSVALAKAATSEAFAPAAALGIFVIGVNHIYMTDALNFSYFILAYALALGLAYGAFLIVWRLDRQSRPLVWIAGLAGAAQLLAFSFSLYQSFAALGLLLPLLALMRVDRFDLGRAAAIVGVSVLVSLAGVALYLTEWRLLTAAAGIVIDERFARPSLDDIVRKLRHLPEFMKRMYGGWMLGKAGRYSVFHYAALGLTVFSVAVASLAQLLQARPRPIDAARIALAGFGAVAVLPVLFWFAYQSDDAPGRAVAFLGFMLATVFITCASLAFRGPALGRIAQAVPAGCAAALVVWGLGEAMISSYAWEDQARSARRDLALAAAIEGRLASLEGYDGQPVRLVGFRRYDDLIWAAEMGRSAFDHTDGRKAIMRELFDPKAVVERVAAAPRACSAFPAYSAVFLDGGAAYVCLAASDGLAPFDACAPVADHGVAEVCRKGRSIVLRLDACRPRGAARMMLSLVRPDGSKKSMDFDAVAPGDEEPDAQQFHLGGACYAVRAVGEADVKRVVVGEYAADGAPAWRRAVDLP